jgi:hypothetical protein
MVRMELCTWFWWGNEGKIPFGRPRLRWEDNTGIRMDLKELGFYSSDSELEQVAGFYAHGNESSGCINCGEILD